MCLFCGSPSCKNGEVCQDLGGLFPHGTSSPHVGPHKETRTYSSRGEIESEHMLPKAAMRKGGVAFSYNDEPTISVPYDMHRGGVSGAGGGITSTGSSSTAQGWSTHLGDLLAHGNWKEAIRQAAIDGLNAAWVSGHLNDGMVSAYIQDVNSHAAMGRLTSTEQSEVLTSILDWYHRRTGRY